MQHHKTYPSHSIQGCVTWKLSIMGLKGPPLPPLLSILLVPKPTRNKAQRKLYFQSTVLRYRIKSQFNAGDFVCAPLTCAVHTHGQSRCCWMTQPAEREAARTKWVQSGGKETRKDKRGQSLTSEYISKAIFSLPDDTACILRAMKFGHQREKL